jgi:hypothetical protein
MGPVWARGAIGVIKIELGCDAYLVEFFEPLDDGSGDGPYSAAPFAAAALSTELEP